MGERRAPETLPEMLTDGEGACRIPFTHDRLNETHHWWHEMANYYHEPEPFRYSFGAWIQAARSVTYRWPGLSPPTSSKRTRG